MNKLFSKKNEKGQGLVEYAIIIALVAIVVIAALPQLAPRVQDAFIAVQLAMDCSEKTVDEANAALEQAGTYGKYEFPMSNKYLEQCRTK